jgi:hypothetical protein
MISLSKGTWKENATGKGERGRGLKNQALTIKYKTKRVPPSDEDEEEEGQGRGRRGVSPR